MPKFRKKPVVIEAIEYTGNLTEVSRFLKGSAWWRNPHGAGVYIGTLEGDHLASLGDYIIRGVAGEFYPCKPDIFAQTYEAADD